MKKIVVLIILVNILISETWTTRTSMPVPGYNCMVGVVNGKIYVIGGETDLYMNYEYDPATDSWTVKSSMLTGRTRATAAVVNNKIYVIGGQGNNNEVFHVNEVYDPLTDTWTQKASMPTARYHLASGVVNNKIYVIGGIDTTGTTSLSVNEEYDPSTDTWNTKASMPTPRERFTIGVVNNKIYAIGGAQISGWLAVNEEYDPLTDTWSTKTRMITPRSNLAAGVIDGKIYLIGGQNQIALSENEMYDPSTDTWVSKLSMPTPRYGLVIGVVNNKIYAIGGADYNSAFATNEEYSPYGAAGVENYTLHIEAEKDGIKICFNSPYPWELYKSEGENFYRLSEILNSRIYIDKEVKKGKIYGYKAYCNKKWYGPLWIKYIICAEKTFRMSFKNKTLRLEFDIKEEGLYRISFISTSGRYVRKYYIYFDKGYKRLKFDLSDFKKGIYFLRFKDKIFRIINM